MAVMAETSLTASGATSHSSFSHRDRVESLSFRTAIVESNKIRGDKGWWSFVRKAKSPELPVILLEDLAALLALSSPSPPWRLTLLTKNGYFDVAGTATIGVLLVVVAIILAIEVKSLLIGEVRDQGVDRPHPCGHRVDGRCHPDHPH